MDAPSVATSRRGAIVYETVCCGCRPKARRYQKKAKPSSSFFKRRTQFFDAQDGNDSQWEDTDSQYFFDAQEQPLKDDEYPIVFTTTLQHPKPKVSLEHPETLLRKSAAAAAPPTEQSIVKKQESVPLQVGEKYERQLSEPIESHRQTSVRFQKITRRPTLEQKSFLEEPRVKITEQGYPGELNFEELAECVSNIMSLNVLLFWFQDYHLVSFHLLTLFFPLFL